MGSTLSSAPHRTSGRAPRRPRSTCRYDAAMPAPTLLYVTQVAPYLDGPAGVHGVLDQSATALAELAETRGMGFERTSDVRDPRPCAARAGAGPGAVHHRRDTVVGEPADGRSSTRSARAGPRCSRSTRPPTRATGGTSTASWSAPGSTAILGPSRSGWRCSNRRTRPSPTSRRSFAWHDEIYTFRGLRPDAQVLLRANPDGPRRRGQPAFGRVPALVVLHRGVGTGLLHLARPLSTGLGDARLPPPPRRRPRLGDRGLTGGRPRQPACARERR